MSSLTEDLAWLLHDDGHGVYVPSGTGGTIFPGILPDEPVDAIAVAAYGGQAADAKLPVDYPRVQLAVGGGPSYTATEGHAQALWDAYAGRGDVTCRSGRRVLLFDPAQSGPIHLPVTARGRTRFVLNFALTVSRATPHRSYV